MNSVKVGIDFGAGRIKYVYVDSNDSSSNKFKQGNFPNRYLVGDNNNGSGYLVERDNYVNKIGCDNGTSNFTKAKINYDYLDDIVLVIAQKIKKDLELKDDVVLDIHTLLPPQQFLEVRKEFKDKLLDYKKYKGKVNGEEIKCEIKNVKIACEAVAQIMVMNKTTLQGYNRAMLVDAGSSTIDLVNLKKNGDKWAVVNAITITIVSGSLIMEAVTSAIKRKFLGTTFETDQLEQDMYFYIGEQEHKVIDYIDGADDVISHLANPMREFYKGGKILLSGGAGELLNASKAFQNMCKESLKSEPELLDEDVRVYGNARGAYLS